MIMHRHDVITGRDPYRCTYCGCNGPQFTWKMAIWLAMVMVWVAVAAFRVGVAW